MPEIIAWQPKEVSAQVIQHLARGACVGLPTESTTEIVASALHGDATERVRALAIPDTVPAVVLADYESLFDWLPLLEGAGARLFRKLGAGPLTLSADAGFRDGLWSRLPDQARQALARDGRLAVRWPAHPIWDELRTANLPLVSVPARDLNAEGLACIVDDGPGKFGVPPTLAQAESRRCKLVREGGLLRDAFDDAALCKVLFICTGNTCRSPIAQALCAKLLAERLGCAVSELKQRGFCVQSAGLAAMMGANATAEAVSVAAEFGADLSHHQSAMASLDMLVHADFVFAMTAGHWYTLMSVPSADIPVPRLLSFQHDDIPDPIGGNLLDYRTCAEQILRCLEQRLPELLES